MTISYKKAAELLNGRKKRKIGNNTYLERIDEVFVVRLYNADIIKIYPDNTQVISSGGCKTVTTKNRISEHSFAVIHQVNKEWRLANGEKFSDAMRINERGEVIGRLVS